MDSMVYIIRPRKPRFGPYHVSIPLLARIPIALVITVVAALRGWAWAIPVAALVALPLIWIWHSFSLLVAALALALHRDRAGD